MEFSNSDGLALAAILCSVLICLSTLLSTNPSVKGCTPISLVWMDKKGSKKSIVQARGYEEAMRLEAHGHGRQGAEHREDNKMAGEC